MLLPESTKNIIIFNMMFTWITLGKFLRLSTYTNQLYKPLMMTSWLMYQTRDTYICNIANILVLLVLITALIIGYDIFFNRQSFLYCRFYTHKYDNIYTHKCNYILNISYTTTQILVVSIFLLIIYVLKPRNIF